MSTEPRRLAILTSGGDAPGMNAVVRAAVRTGLAEGARMYAVADGFQGLVDGGERIMRQRWGSVGGILYRGGTVIGTARCAAFREPEGRKAAALNLLRERIDGLIVMGGDGTLTGADILRREWPALVRDLAAEGRVLPELVKRHPFLALVGLAGSIDNDMPGTDMTIGADTALHRITEAVDALTSTAASHQRAFVVEVMGRHCGYLALMSALATGASWVLIPEAPPETDDWEERMCGLIREGRKAGRRHSVVIVAEGAVDRTGKAITAEHVRAVLEHRLSAEVRVTVLGHVQRGGSPSAFDRTMGALLGHAAVQEVLAFTPDSTPQVIGLRENRVTRTPLVDCVQRVRAMDEALAARDPQRCLDLRGAGFRGAFSVLKTLVRALPHPPDPGHTRRRFAVLHAGPPAPGMNTAVRAAVRSAIDRGHVVLGVRNGFAGFLAGEISELDWMSVHGWVGQGGAELGTSSTVPSESDAPALARLVDQHGIEGLLVIGGWAGYEAAYRIFQARAAHASLNIPVICLPASIDNNLPGSELAIGADTALNTIVSAVDKIKQSAVARRRCFVVEVMGGQCGYLALISGIATGAERVYLPEEPLSMADLEHDVRELVAGFQRGKRLGLMIRNERAHPVFTTDFLRSLFDSEGKGLFDARQSILGHMQQGGDPTPFDRIHATRLAIRCVDFLIEESGKPEPRAVTIGLRAGRIGTLDLADFPAHVDPGFQRARDPWWLSLRPIAHLFSQPGPEVG